MQLTHEIELAVPPEAVWAVLSDVPAWPSWTPTVRSARALDGPTLTVGRRFALRQPLQRETVWRVVEVGPGHAFRWRTEGPSGFDAAHAVHPRQGGCRVIATLSPLGRTTRLWTLLRPALRLALELEARGLAEHVALTSMQMAAVPPRRGRPA